MFRLALAIQLMFSVSLAFADDSGGTLGAATNLTDATAQGAVDNHNNSETLYSHSHHHHHMAHMGGPSAASMMAQAVAEGQKAFAAQNQAQEMAKAAMNSMNSASASKDQNAVGANAADLALMQQIATQQSELAQEVQAEMAADGYSLGTAQSTVATPTDTAALTAGGTGSGGATTLRAPAANGTASGVVYVPAGTVGVAAGAATPGSEAEKAAAAKTAATAANAADSAQALGAGAAQGSSANKDLLDQRQLLARNRAAILKQLGGSVAGAEQLDENGQPIAKSPIRAKNENIFEVVHVHYQTLRGGGTFYEANLPTEEVKTRNSLPAFSKGF